MIAGALIWIASPVAIFIGTTGAGSVTKAIYVEKRGLNCACAGGRWTDEVASLVPSAERRPD